VTQNLEMVGASRTVEPDRRARRPAASRHRRQRWWRRPWIIPLAVVVAAFLYITLPPYLTLDPAQSRVPLHEAFPPHYVLLVAHIGFGTVAMVTVCLQVWPWLRRRFPAVHRMSGRAYVFAGVLPSTLLILVTLPYSVLKVGALGGAVSGVLWLVTAIAGFRAARQRRFAAHRRWMIYSFALALNTLTGRVIYALLLIPGGFGLDQLLLAEIAGFWLGTVANLAAAHLWLQWRARKRPRRAKRPVAAAITS
jgi:hypothetical protein